MASVRGRDMKGRAPGKVKEKSGHFNGKAATNIPPCR